MTNTAIHILNQYWGHSSFRKPQQEIITSVIEGKDTIALLPTGGGKSICFQIPALLNKGVCIVISPLLALIQDQVDSLTQKGIKATSLPSGSSQDELITLFDNIRFGNYKFLYISPERLQSKFIQEKIKQLNVNLIAVDEAHCISEWGHDFRPSYLLINIVRELHPTVPVIALTATATQKVIKDISSFLNLHSPTLFKQSFARENLAYQVFYTQDKLYKLTQITYKTQAPIIVYVSSRNKTKEISAYLNANGFKSGFYHGGLSAIEKQVAFDRWMLEETPIIVATNAFGMGINKPNVRVVVHLNIPSSLENYMQEAGRAGRDGKKAFSVILSNQNDIQILKENQAKQIPSINEVKIVYQKLFQHFQIAKGEFIEAPFDFDFSAFCHKYNFVSSKTQNILQVLSANGIIELTNTYHQKSSIQFLMHSNQLIQYGNKNGSDIQNLIQTLLRLYGGIFEQAIKIDEFYIAKKTGNTSWNVVKNLEILNERGIITYTKASKNATLYFLHPREDDRTINPISKNIERYFNQKKQKINDVIHYITNNDICRNQLLLTYFDEKTPNTCGICDVCLQKKKSNTPAVSKMILTFLETKKEASSKEICTFLNEKEEDILIHLRKLLANEVIGLTTYNKYFIK
ncbi:RecQ family ATP-dependent DNA helicase [Tenacibaculum sp. TC6]|uniref:RecQ family ATP-dependent DNA helicase n=1 Tax=Tenacibaculum sp. TC6 TaxID=3423223 RepID=UPI003D3609CE